MVADLITQVTWNVDPTLIHTSWFSVRWYGLMFAIGFIVGYEIECRIYKREGAPESWMPTLLVWVLVATIVGARLGHVFFY
ncbi:MAG: prolipoprotein diacylglyceryl transferase, partial [Paramuribaculum sp.]|nr:prolipoprotein diacylglyceryl transferase [Paramuribaculum sp.]